MSCSALFTYAAADCSLHPAGSGDVNAYLSELTGEDFTAKHFRTWDATLAAFLALRGLDPPATKAEAQRNVKWAIEQASALLGNTPTIARKSYVHPAVIEAYTSGRLASLEGGHPPR